MSLHVDRAGHGPDLVLLHGWGLHSGAWAEQLPALAARFTVHTVDLPGHGHSHAVAPGTFDDTAEEIARLVPEGAALCGWSLGGLLAQRIAVAHPRKVRALALVASTPCFMARKDWPHGMSASVLASFAKGLAQDREGMLLRFVRVNALHGARGREAIRALTARLDERPGTSADALATTLGWLRDTDLRAAAPSIQAPTVVVHGRRDALAPVEAGRWLARNIPGARLVELPDAAHLPFFSHREEFLAAVEPALG
jgi:pimeloyl-[acyl-carrier protein] methyl ester esterase